MQFDSKILITGSNGMVGKNLVERLKKEGYSNLLTPNSKELDLRIKDKVEAFFSENKPEYVFHVASKVGGIKANMESPAEFLYDNLMIASNVVESCKKFNIKKLLFLGSSCIYPRECPQPMKEEYLLSSKLEPTNEGFALSKISGLKLCEFYNSQYGTNFISLMPCNLYGFHDHFEPEKSHVMSASILRFFEAKEKNLPFVEVWGTGNVKREFLFVDDLVDAMIHFMLNYDAKDLNGFVNVGSGEDVSIKELSLLIKEVIGYEGEVKFDPSKPEGMPRKVLDVNKAKELGWKSKTSLKEGVLETINWYLKNK
jgi:GDP-L-fucose synthase